MKKICLILLCLLSLSCDSDPIEAGVVTNIQGVVFDDWNKIPFENLKIKVGEFKSEFSGITYTNHFIQWIDSTYTDQNGYYDLDFKTSGQGDHYELRFQRDENVWFHPSMSYAEIDSIGTTNYQDFDFVHLYPIKLVIDLNNIDQLPIAMYVQYYRNQELENITSGSGTVERIIYANKHTHTELNFLRIDAPDESDLFEVLIPASNTSELTKVNLTINNSDFK